MHLKDIIHHLNLDLSLENDCDITGINTLKEAGSGRNIFSFRFQI